MQRHLTTTTYRRLACLFLITWCSLVPLHLHPQQLQFRQYGTAEGLNNLNVRSLIQDGTGYIWVGTDNGLFRFDGSEFRKYGHSDGLPSTEINALAESPLTHQLWAVTSSGLVRFDNGHFIPFPIRLPNASDALRSIAFDQAGAMYLIDNNVGILKGVPDRNVGYAFSLLITGDVHSILLRQDAVYFGRGTKLWRLQMGREEVVGDAIGLPDDCWAALAFDPSGNLWVRSITRLFKVENSLRHVVDESAGLPHAVEPRLSVDRRGRLFVSTMTGAVIYAGDQRTVLDADHGLVGQAVAPILPDRDDTIWLGMTGAGLVRLLGHGEWSSWKRQNGLLHNSVWAIHRDLQGKVWVGTSGGLTLLNRDGIAQHSWSMSSGLSADRVLAIEQMHTGDVFVGTDPIGLSQFSADGKLLRTYEEAEGITGRVTAMASDRQHHLWVIGQGGVLESGPVELPNQKLVFKHATIENMQANASFRDIVVTEAGVVWVATSKGLLRNNQGQWRIFSTADGLVSDDLGALAERNGQVWVAYRDALGMTCFTVDGDTLHGHPITSRDGLASDDVYALAFDHQGRLWINDDKGVDVFAGDRWQHFSSQDGLVWDDTNGRALEVDADDNVWVGTSNGMSRYSRPPFATQLHAPSPVLTAIHGETQEYQPGDRPLLPYSERALTIQYAALGSTVERPRYRYRLVGYADKWIESAGRTVQYAALPPGRYEFQMETQGADGNWGTARASFSFHIATPWWQRLSFLSTSVIFLLLTARILWRLRIKALIAQKERLQRVVEQQTAELREKHRQLEGIAYLDQLTALPNRRMFSNELRSRIERSRRTEDRFALLLIDLDRFKFVNDTFGHDAGDAVLSSTGARLRDTVRGNDLVARLGGDEFAIILDHESTRQSVEAFCKRLLESVARVIPFEGQSLQVGCSVGIALFPRDGETEEALCKAADLALYEVKRGGRQSFHWYRSEVQSATCATQLPQPQAI